MKKIYYFLFFLLLFSFSCQKVEAPDPERDLVYTEYNDVDLSTPIASSLNNDGGFLYLNEGRNGILVVKDFSGAYHAFARACPYTTLSCDGTIFMSSNGLNIVCGSYSGNSFNPCGPSSWNLDGSVLHGPATVHLAEYNTRLSGTILHITN